MNHIYLKNLRFAFGKLVLYDPEDQSDDDRVVHYDLHKEGINTISQIGGVAINRALIKGFYKIKEIGKVKKIKFNKNVKGVVNLKKTDIYTCETLDRGLSKCKSTGKSSKTLGLRQRSLKNLQHKTTARKSPKYQFKA